MPFQIENKNVCFTIIKISKKNCRDVFTGIKNNFSQVTFPTYVKLVKYKQVDLS